MTGCPAFKRKSQLSLHSLHDVLALLVPCTLFDAEVLSKLEVEDHLRLAQVNKECKDVVYKLSPVEFLSTCPISRMDSSPYDHNLYMYVY